MQTILQLAATSALLLASAVSALSISQPLVSAAGQHGIIPGWHLQSERHVSSNLSFLSSPGADVSSWYRVGSRGTVMAGLLENNVYNESHLFFSDNFKSLPDADFRDVAWLYREQFTLQPMSGQYFTLHTHGISSKGDIYLNGQLIASKDVQAGSYAGHQYDVTRHVRRGENCLLIKAYHTNYLRDLALGFVDWNPYPPDNGTGVWRDVEFSQSGPIRLSSPRVTTDFVPGANINSAKLTVKTDVRNIGKQTVTASIRGFIEGAYSQRRPISAPFTLNPGEGKTIEMSITIKNPKIWWPASWGDQPLYTAQISAFIGRSRSDGPKRRRFGIRHIESRVNDQDTVEFKVNGNPFFVMGAGYSSDIFLRFTAERITAIFQYILDMGMNTVRLEGKQEHPELYDIADKMGLMIISGWECCDHWEGWTYNTEGFGQPWTEVDYPIANSSMLHEAEMMQTHPSVLAFLVGSDYWPNDRATKIYADALKRMDWNAAVISSAAKRGFPKLLGPSGMKMDGPYDWVPPSYWYGDKLGAAGAGGFGSELGSGVGTPEIRSLKKFLSAEDMNDLWTQPNKILYHMSAGVSQFRDRGIYNKALYARYGEPKSLEDYSLKAQLMDYEATRSEYEAYVAYKSNSNPTSGLIYWMLNPAWPNLHWALFDYYLKPMASYFGTKTGARIEHAVFDYREKVVYLINHSLSRSGARSVTADLIDIDGKSMGHSITKANTIPLRSQKLSNISGLDKVKDVAFLRLLLKDNTGKALSRNVYWLPQKEDVLDWGNSTWYHTPVTKYADLKSLSKLRKANVNVDVSIHGRKKLRVTLQNRSSHPAFFIRLSLLDKATGDEVTPVFWEDNYVTLWPHERLVLEVTYPRTNKVELEVSGYNVEKKMV
ncbi:exo-beta-D-glucosaminidase [Nannizzia gypsea CBS 118893]|uniref:Exo-beta-D-glucosaminidase n=1 Tax=Arthroderma gypseum (strain ATCC MYA-4604 / CBS 118893) TaxID=535722 RepID=E4V717_ARTGP|nr:exo-beta-D-glucosaminidase [Nannizzia gypsea CBS 118893]EFQ96883.1 exo-beta-D-glucosaminidase [Nannizzia gypsea CBS 118893]